MENPLIVQSDRTLLLDVHAPRAEEARSAILPFAELEKSPEHIHTYRITPLSLWNAASAGYTPEGVTAALNEFTRYAIPSGVTEGFSDTMARYGKIRLVAGEGAEELPNELFLVSEDEAIAREIGAAKILDKYLVKGPGFSGFKLKFTDRGSVKRELIRLGWPVQDEAPFAKGEPLDIRLKDPASSGRPFAPRDYQVEAAKAVLGSGGPGSGYGVVVLPCGSGKTVVGMAFMSLLKTNTLILTTNVAAVHQWMEELLDKTELKKEEIAEYTGDSKSVAPVTVATYQIITWRPDKAADFPHFKLFRERPWGLIIYDEVHLLPAPVFRVTAELQAVRRLGLTATLVREDGAEDAVFSLVGPKRYDVPWKDLEGKGWIAEAFCTEIRLELPGHLKIPYAVAAPREKYRLASENPLKEEAVVELIQNHPDDQILVIGQYLSQLDSLAKLLKVPLITGKTPNTEREKIYNAFKKGEVRVIVVSRVANFAIDLPDASMAIQVSGSFGSRQEEAQRLGRILRPKDEGRSSWFYTLVSRYTVEEDFAANRQQFLAEQGYKYSIQHWTAEELALPAPQAEAAK
ncbi:dna repair helicase Rad25 (general transcription and dnarepair factor iih subunit rad25) (tfiih subunit rad25) [Leadbettera azotonutricia ZAS-9]|uniref:DNA 3'-5' helicase n=2 Tax=Leadbettera azotonutricia TaxID=150829 RepID=F5YCH5_LEAAZ|nr:dna repair helicase Rad25 (general transcription and dnarepair factor iih subunit rad25) (tfiih subunit rad25) [Leadbettera azotonutricia ZAS-9]